MPKTKKNGLPWFDVTNLPRREMLERAVKGAGRVHIEELLKADDLDRVGRSVLEKELEVRKHFKCD